MKRVKKWVLFDVLLIVVVNDDNGNADYGTKVNIE